MEKLLHVFAIPSDRTESLVSKKVPPEVRHLACGVGAVRAGVGPLPRVDHVVVPEVPPVVEPATTNGALELHARVIGVLQLSVC